MANQVLRNEGMSDNVGYTIDLETKEKFPVKVIAGKECPKCGNCGIFIYEFVICESCLTRWDKDPRKFIDAKELK